MKLVALEIEEPEVPHCNPHVVWLRVVYDGGAEDTPALLDSFPPGAEWLEYEFECGGLENILGCNGGQPWWEWMLREGIAPRQEFLVRVERPCYTKDYWGEHDIDYGDATVVWRKPLPDGVDGMLWFAWIRDVDWQKVEGFKI
jgi:hypothetical protein